MIQEITFGILMFAFGVGAYLSARKMARGPVYYHGKTFPGRRPAAQQEHTAIPKNTPADEVQALVLLRYFLECQDEFVPRSEVIRVLGHAFHSRVGAQADSILARVEARVAAQARKVQERTAGPEGDPADSQKWKDNVEKRLRALEEKSLTEQMSGSENPEIPSIDRIH